VEGFEQRRLLDRTRTWLLLDKLVIQLDSPLRTVFRELSGDMAGNNESILLCEEREDAFDLHKRSSPCRVGKQQGVGVEKHERGGSYGIDGVG